MNHSPILLFSSPRSYSTVTCAMLGRHKSFYGFPELNLFLVDTIDELLNLGNGPTPYSSSYLTGLLRTIAELKFHGQTDGKIEEARKWITSRSHWTTKQMFDYLLDGIDGKTRIEKSPRTCLSQKSIDRALAGYPNARIIHITRHPVSTLNSLITSHQQYADGQSFGNDAAWLANFYIRLWIRSQELILSTFRRIDRLQAFRLRGENLLSQPDHYLARLFVWLGNSLDIQSLEAMKHPENSPYACPAPMGMIGDGDPHFHQSPYLRILSSLEYPRSMPDWRIDASLIAKANEIASILGYGKAF